MCGYKNGASTCFIPGTPWIQRNQPIYLIPHQNGCHFNTFHITSLSGSNSRSTEAGWSNHPGEKSRHKPKPAPTKEHKSKPPLPWPRHKQKTLQRPNCWYVPGDPERSCNKKKHRNWMRHPKWFTLDLKMLKQVVGMLQYYLWDDDALPTSLTTQLA